MSMLWCYCFLLLLQFKIHLRDQAIALWIRALCYDYCLLRTTLSFLSIHLYIYLSIFEIVYRIYIYIYVISSICGINYIKRSNQLSSKHLIQSPVILPTRRYWTSINCSFFISFCSCFRHYSFLYFYFIFLYINSWITHFQINNWELLITFY